MAKKKKKTTTTSVSVTSFIPNAQIEVKKGEELISLANSKSEAEKLAKDVNIVFVNFEMGVATYHTTEDYQTVIKRAKDKGYVVSMNTVQNLITPVTGNGKLTGIIGE